MECSLFRGCLISKAQAFPQYLQFSAPDSTPSSFRTISTLHVRKSDQDRGQIIIMAPTIPVAVAVSDQVLSTLIHHISPSHGDLSQPRTSRFGRGAWQLYVQIITGPPHPQYGHPFRTSVNQRNQLIPPIHGTPGAATWYNLQGRVKEESAIPVPIPVPIQTSPAPHDEDHERLKLHRQLGAQSQTYCPCSLRTGNERLQVAEGNGWRNQGQLLNQRTSKKRPQDRSIYEFKQKTRGGTDGIQQTPRYCNPCM